MYTLQSTESNIKVFMLQYEEEYVCVYIYFMVPKVLYCTTQGGLGQIGMAAIGLQVIKRLKSVT